MNDNPYLRQQTLALRDELGQALRREKSKQIAASLLTLPEIQQASTLFVYVNFRSEVETLPLIRKFLEDNKQVTVPVTMVAEKKLLAVRITNPNQDLQPGYCGIPEPAPRLWKTNSTNPASIDAVIVPGSVFDKRGGRLGYGGGYYDRFLSLNAPRAIRIALAYELQLVDRIYLEPHDQPMDRIITEDKIYFCRRI